MQSFTFCASSHPITYLGAKPVFIGSERDTWNLGFCLPAGPYVTDDDVRYIVDCIREAIA